jgi:hypothetical protein
MFWNFHGRTEKKNPRKGISEDTQYKNYNTWHRTVLGILGLINQNEFYRN